MAKPSNGVMTEPQMNLLGMNMRQDADKIPDSSSPLLVNVMLDKPGVWAKRPGSTILGPTQAGTGIQGAIDYIAYNGTHSVRVIRGGNLDVYDGVNTWNTTLPGQFTIGVKVQSALLNNRVYHTSPSDNLIWETGGAATTVGTGGNEIKAQNISVAQNTLFVGNVTYVGGIGAVSYQDRVYYSFFDSVNNLPSDQLYSNALTQNTLATSARFFTLLAPNTALFTYGVTGLTYAFTSRSCYQFDLRASTVSQSGLQKVFNIGCCGPRAITECNGWMIWMDNNARIWAWGGSGPPIPLSWGIENDSYGSAFINQIDRSGLADVAAGTYLNTFWFDVGTVTAFNETMTNVRVKGLVTQGLQNVLYTLDTYPFRASIFLDARLNNTPIFLFGATGVNDVYQINAANYDDNGVAISMKAKTKFYFLGGDTLKTNSQKELFVKYKPQATTPTYLVAKYAVDLETTYTTFSDPVNANTTGGAINMYSTSTTKKDAIGRLQLPQEARGRSISYEFGNSQIDQGCEISGFGLVGDHGDLDISINAT